MDSLQKIGYVHNSFSADIDSFFPKNSDASLRVNIPVVVVAVQFLFVFVYKIYLRQEPQIMFFFCFEISLHFEWGKCVLLVFSFFSFCISGISPRPVPVSVVTYILFIHLP